MTSLIDLGGIKDAMLEAILDALENPDPDDPQQEAVLNAQLAELELEIASKVDAIAGVFAAKQAEINYLVERREHFDKLAKSRQNAIDRLKAYVKLALERQGATSIAGKEASLRLVKNGGKPPVWVNPDIKPQDFPLDVVNERITFSVSTESVRSKLAEAGMDELIGEDGRILAKLQERGTHLRIG
ncbi:siphovirus Gp157 family protein [Chamaesiphon sp.]|uniref:siphovirus Gp157 family protein n=1 Tax=Chamaesiphon sp. TaxID=2814140 RepID=UPI003593C11E